MVFVARGVGEEVGEGYEAEWDEESIDEVVDYVRGREAGGRWRLVTCTRGVVSG